MAKETFFTLCNKATKRSSLVKYATDISLICMNGQGTNDEITEFKKTRKAKGEWLFQGKFKNKSVSMMLSIDDEFIENYPDVDEFYKEQLLDWCRANPPETFRKFDVCSSE